MLFKTSMIKMLLCSNSLFLPLYSPTYKTLLRFSYNIIDLIMFFFRLCWWYSQHFSKLSPDFAQGTLLMGAIGTIFGVGAQTSIGGMQGKHLITILSLQHSYSVLFFIVIWFNETQVCAKIPELRQLCLYWILLSWPRYIKQLYHPKKEINI